MLKTRIASAAIGIPVLLALAWLGGWYWLAFAAVITFIALTEYLKAIKSGGRAPVWLLAVPVAAVAFLSPYYPLLALPGFTGMFLFSVFLMVFSFPRYHIIDISAAFFGALFLGLTAGYTAQLGFQAGHFCLITYSLLLTWSGDTGAYFVGTWCGKYKMAPVLSPHKTWEGFAGGAVLTVLVAFSGIWLIPGHEKAVYGVMGVLAAGLGTLGDLFASGIKRNCGIKDFGSLIPGHGGILDRFDS